MSNEKTTEGLKKLVVLALVLQSIEDRDLVADKLLLSMSLQEVAKVIGDAHHISWRGLVAAAIEDIQQELDKNVGAEDLATSAILKAMGHKLD